MHCLDRSERCYLSAVGKLSMVRQGALAVLLALLSAAISAAGDIDASGTVLVTCGSVIKLQHDKVKVHLHSHEVAYGYGRGSGQQSVTGFPGKDSAESMWVVRRAEGACLQGTPIAHGTQLKLQHSTTRKWLHSHLFSSPLSGSQEVSCFGAEDETDTGDIWQIEWDSRAKVWERDQAFRLKHVDTGVYLASHDVKYQRPIPGHTEVFGSKQRSANAVWRVTEGIFFPERKEQ